MSFSLFDRQNSPFQNPIPDPSDPNGPYTFGSNQGRAPPLRQTGPGYAWPSSSSFGRSSGPKPTYDRTTGGHLHSPAREWSFNGLTIPLDGLAELKKEQVATEANPPPPDRKREPPTELRVYQFAKNFKVEIVKDAETALSVYITCKNAPPYKEIHSNEILLLVNLCIRESHQKVAARSPVVWEYWKEHGFEQFSDTLKCPLPSLDFLLENAAIRTSDEFVLTIQMQTPTGTRHSYDIPRMAQLQTVPNNMLAGLADLFDDPKTSDVLILCYEKRDSSTEFRRGSSRFALGEQHDYFRKRCIYAHSSILKNRISYFQSLFSGNWPDTHSNGKQSEIKIDAEYAVSFATFRASVIDQTVWTLLKYVYTDEVNFGVSNKARETFEELPEGLLDATDTSSNLSWSWQAVETESVGFSDLFAENASAHIERQRKEIKRLSDRIFEERKAREVAGPTRKVASPTQTRTSHSQHSSQSDEQASKTDEHEHPFTVTAHPSALAVYRLADLFGMDSLAELAKQEIIENLDISNALAMYLATHLYGDLSDAILKIYMKQRMPLITKHKEYSKCFLEVGRGAWPGGGEALLRMVEACYKHD